MQMAHWCGMFLLVSSVAHAGVGGSYATPLGPVVLKQKGSTVSGVMAQAGGPCGYKKGQSVLKGTLMDDSVTGTVHICSETPGCKEQDAFVVLLVARNGELLSGAVQSKQKQCKLPLDGKGIAFSREAAGKTAKKHVPRAARQKQEKKAAPVEEKPAPDEKPTQKAVEEPFASWNPGIADVSGAGRKDALRIARQAESLMNSGKHEEARPVLMEAIQADPAFAEGYNMMGATYYARDNYDDALDWYKKALTVNPDFGDAYYNIACIYAVEGKKALALKYLRIALLNGYAQPHVIEKDNDLDGLREDAEYAEIIKLATGPAEPPPSTESASSSSSTDAPDAAQ